MITRPCPLPLDVRADAAADDPRRLAPPRAERRDAIPAGAPAPSRPRGGSTLAVATTSLIAALFLAACGGGGDGMTASPPPPPPPPPPAPNELPVSAAASVDSWEAYAVSLAPTETAEPLMLDLITTVPTSETDEPIAVP